MVSTDTLEGIIDQTLRFHYDRNADVLYLRLTAHEQTETYADPTDDGDLLLLDATTDKPVGITVISFWKRFGQGARPDSISQIESLIEPWARKVAA
jgi:uncharacterized protein YuzE